MKDLGDELNAYIHIPFCASICSYCDFTSFAGQESKIFSYVDALCREIETSGLQGPLRTVYFGGGTPSLLSPDQLGKILKSLKMKAGFFPNAEISMEANPETVGLEKLKAFRSSGVNRLSFGAQASQKEILKRLGRGHDWEKVEESFHAARQAGFDNVNLDLMFGLPGQTLAMFQESLQKAVALGPDHHSLYALQVEKGTPLAGQVSAGLSLPTEDEVADEYAWAQGFLSERGFEQYEVSNFAQPGKQCAHNWNIWRGEDYWGFGVGAVGTVKGSRVTHGEDLGGYIQKLSQGAAAPVEEEVLPAEVQEWEKIMLGLRTQEGVLRRDVERLASARGISFEKKFDLFEREGLLSSSDGRFRPQAKGYFVLHGILETLMV